MSSHAGSVGFDLKAGGGTGIATWTSSDGTAIASVGSLELSNQAPASGADCTASPVNDGDVWIGVDASFSYVPASLRR
jgi:hypothetical protein